MDLGIGDCCPYRKYLLKTTSLCNRCFHFPVPNLQRKIRVKYRNSAGLDEGGVDLGGLCREFLNDLVKTGFDPNRGLFAYTHDKLVYPNPHAKDMVEDYTKHYHFMGRILGKVRQDVIF